MAFFLVEMTHPDGPAWGQHAQAHVDYLRALVRKGTLRASGPIKGAAKRAGFLIFESDSLETVEALVGADPFAINGVIENLEIRQWDPLFGDYSGKSSGDLPGLGPTG